MTYKTTYSKRALKFLRKSLKSDKELGKRLLKSINQIQKNPYKNKKLDGRFKGTRRQKESSYRIIYEILENNTIKILDIGKRGVIYKKR